MAPKPPSNRLRKSVTEDGIVWVDPRAMQGSSFVWEDDIHIVRKVEVSRRLGVAYVLRCGTMFHFAAMPGVMEAKLDLPVFPTCKKCLE